MALVAVVYDNESFCKGGCVGGGVGGSWSVCGMEAIVMVVKAR